MRGQGERAGVTVFSSSLNTPLDERSERLKGILIDILVIMSRDSTNPQDDKEIEQLMQRVEEL